MKPRIAFALVAVLLVLALGYWLGTLRSVETPSSDRADHSEAESRTEAPTIWTCSMHPQIRLPQPGQCPICFMDLIPLVPEGAGDGKEVQLSMSPAALKLAEVQTAPVVRGFVTMDLRMFGKVEYDETRVKVISAWVPGRLDRLFVDYTGVPIRKGDHLVSMYSPELVSSQEELLQALRARETLRGSGIGILRETAEKTITAARDKLRLLGVTSRQIERLEERGEVEDHVTIFAPIDGIVTSKRAVEGSYVSTGMPIYEIADLSHLWVKLDAYESDLVWLRYGQELSFSTEAYPGRAFTGRIAFIDPVLDPATRTVKVRVNVENPGLLLKPEMFVRATAHPTIAAQGRVMAAEISGKWISPMHPEIIKDGPGACDVCGMALVPVEEMGYETIRSDEQAPLIIPATAPLVTGRRAVVYVQLPATTRPTFEGREVVLGPRAGAYYIVESGLSEGESVVVNGAFKIDSAMQIRAKPSMMAPSGGITSPGHNHGDGPGPPERDEHSRAHGPDGSGLSLHAPEKFRAQLGALAQSYLDFTAALAADDAAAAAAAAAAMPQRLESVDMSLLDAPAHEAWMHIHSELRTRLKRLAEKKGLDHARAELSGMTSLVADALRRLGVRDDLTVRRFHCPMANDGAGGDWLQAGESTANPYYGASMLRCGSQVEALNIAGESGR